MKKILVLIAALLAFSVLCTSVSAGVPEYYVASFYGEAEGCCWVFEYQPMEPPLLPDASGKGSLYVRGSAIAGWDPSSKVYWACKLYEPTRLWTRRTRLTASWNNEKLMVWMWPSYETVGLFNDTTNTITLMMMNFFGYYIGESLKFIRGIATVQVGILPTPIGTYILAAAASLYIGSMDPADHFRTFVWQGEETEILPLGCLTRRIIDGVAVWPIPWYLPPP